MSRRRLSLFAAMSRRRLSAFAAVSRRRLPAFAAALTLLAACSPAGDARERIRVGVGSTHEQRVLAAVTALALDRAGMDPELRTDLGGTVGLRREAIGGGIDVFWDYTGAAWALGMGQQAPPADPGESYERVRRADEGSGLTWLQPSGANATLALFVRTADLPPENRPRGLAWLGAVLSRGGQRLCADSDFLRRRGGLEALAAAYGMDLERVAATAVPATEATAIKRAASGRCFAALATATSGEARRAGLVPVADELGVFPAFIVSPVARSDRVADVAELADVLEPVARVLDTDTLAGLNARAEAGERPEEIAADFLAAALPRTRQ